MLVEHRRSHRVALLDFPVARLQGDDLHPRRVHRIPEAGGALLGIGGRGDPFDDADLVAGLQSLRQVLADQPRTLAVVGPDEGHADLLRLQHLRVEAVVDVDHHDAGIQRFLHHRHQRLGIGRRDHQCVDPGNDHLLDDADLAGGIGLVLDAVGNQFEPVGMLLLVGLGAVLHGQEELVRQRLHHQRDPGLLGSFRVDGGQGQERGTGSQHNGSQQAPGSDPLHGVSSSFSYRCIEAFPGDYPDANVCVR